MVAPGLGPPTGNPLMDALSPLPTLVPGELIFIPAYGNPGRGGPVGCMPEGGGGMG